MMNRRDAREQAFIFVFEGTFTNDSLEEIIDSAKIARGIEICDFTKKIFNGINDNKLVIDGLIEKNIVGWKKDRLPRVAISILRLAVFEMLYEDKVPMGVSINEAVELTKKYSTKEDAAFVNGILGSIYKEIEKEEN